MTTNETYTGAVAAFRAAVAAVTDTDREVDATMDRGDFDAYRAAGAARRTARAAVVTAAGVCADAWRAAL
jgi:hypothetical protein